MFKCIICKKKAFLYFSNNKFKYYKCNKCEIVSTQPYPSKSEIIKHYKNEFKSGNYKFIRDYESDYNRVYRGFAKEIKEYYKSTNNTTINNKSLLDIGCFTGEFLKIMQKEGVDVYGIELQKEAAQIANKKIKNKRVLAKNVDSNPFGDKKFDIITMFGLIEHVENPNKLINESVKKLKKNGIIVIQTPNSGSALAKLLKKYWPPYTPVEHIHLFSKNSLNLILNKNKFEIYKFKNHIKILPISYVYNMLSVFSPELKKNIDRIPFVKFYKINIPIPFFIGEMIIIAGKND